MNCDLPCEETCRFVCICDKSVPLKEIELDNEDKTLQGVIIDHLVHNLPFSNCRKITPTPAQSELPE